MRVRAVAVTRVDREVKASVVARLREKKASGAAITADVRRAATGLSVSERTVWGWLGRDERGEEGEPSRWHYELTEADLDEYAAWRGNVAAVRRVRLEAGDQDMPPLRTLQRAFAAQLTPGQRAAVVDGTEGWRRHQVYLRWAPDRRNALWEADHKELPVLVMAPRAQQPRKPWVTLFVDGFSRLIMGWALSLVPNAAVVLAALRRGIVVDPERGPFGGLPEKLVPDNGLEFAASALTRSSAALGSELAPTPAYQGYSKGKVERVNRTLDQEFLSGLPFYTDGPRAADGHLFGPDVAPMRLELFCDRFAEWVRDYNTERVHSELGQSPLARWGADATPLREVPAEELRWMLMADTERTIGKDGVHFGGLRFIAPSSTAGSGRRCRSATPRTTCARSRCSTATPRWPPRTRRSCSPVSSGPRCSSAAGPKPPSSGNASAAPAAAPAPAWRRSPRRARWSTRPPSAPGRPAPTRPARNGPDVATRTCAARP